MATFIFDVYMANNYVLVDFFENISSYDDLEIIKEYSLKISLNYHEKQTRSF